MYEAYFMVAGYKCSEYLCFYSKKMIFNVKNKEKNEKSESAIARTHG
jgi:hypothetical protein